MPIILPQRWTSQPQDKVAVDQRWIALGLNLVIAPVDGRMMDFSPRNALGAGGVQFMGTTTAGVGVGRTSGDYGIRGLNSSQTFSRIAVIRPVTVAGDQTISDSRTGGSNGSQFRISTGQLGLLKAGTASIGSSTGAGLAAGKTSVVGVTYDGTTASFFVDGVAKGSGSSAQTFTVDTSGVLWVAGNDSEAFTGLIALHIDFNRPLAASHMAQLTANPWQIFAPMRGLLLAEDATGVSGTSATTNANDTSSASGTTTILGTSATTNANDTSAASGATTIVGTSATTNANDTSAASGATTIVGTSATTNANDTSTASGSVGNVTGTSATTNANDTSSASGTTTILGTSATTNANDTSTASGTAGNPVVSTKVGGDDVPREEYWEIRREKKPRKKVAYKAAKVIVEEIPPVVEKPVYKPLLTSQSIEPLVQRIKQLLLKAQLEQEQKEQSAQQQALQAEQLRLAQQEAEEEQEVIMVLKSILDEDKRIYQEWLDA